MKPLSRFTHRAADYALYRPAYPAEIATLLETDAGLATASLVADAGAGTGISSMLLAARGHRVLAFEPNAAMRAEIPAHPLILPAGARAEQLPLPSASVDAVLCAQTFHWLEKERARDEFLRVARPGGLIILLWSIRRKRASAFLSDLEDLLVRLAPDYATRISPDTDSSVVNLDEVFAPSPIERRSLFHSQRLDWHGLEGRMRSTSFVPLEDHPNHQEFFASLRSIYDTHNTGGFVSIEYAAMLSWLRRA